MMSGDIGATSLLSYIMKAHGGFAPACVTPASARSRHAPIETTEVSSLTSSEVSSLTSIPGAEVSSLTSGEVSSLTSTGSCAWHTAASKRWVTFALVVVLGGIAVIVATGNIIGL